MKVTTILLCAVVFALGCGASPGALDKPSPREPAAPLVVRSLVLPGGGPAGVSMDYLACDRPAGRVWVPAGNTGSVDVIETATDKITRIEGFPTAEVERDGKKRVVGPSSVTLGEGFAYVGNRADSQVCAIDARTLRKGACVALPTPPDGLAYVSTTKEVWVTTPRDQSITILDVTNPTAPALHGKIALQGQPEGYAVDEQRGVFYTSFEDADRTLAIDVRARRVSATWDPQCGEAGPRGLIVDPASRFVVVACTDHLVSLDGAHDGRRTATLPLGAGIDNIDFLPARHEVYVAAGKDQKLAVARLGEDGSLTVTASATTSPGARNVVADQAGNAYLADSAQGRILVVARAVRP